MLEYIDITNFKNHEKQRIEFDKYVTVLIGPNGAGKSAIIQALKWAFLNKPNGLDFLSWDAKTVRVEVGIDKQKVIRKKGKENLYFINKQKYTAFGNDIPESIQKLTNIDAVNFQSQLDSPFWFFQTAGEVAKELNQIVNLGLIDKTFGNISSELKAVRSVLSVCEDRLIDYEKERKLTEWSVKADSDLKAIEFVSEEISKYVLKRSRIDDLLKKVVSLTDTNKRLGKAINAFAEVASCGKQIKEAKERKRKLDLILTQYKDLQLKKKKCIPVDALSSLRKLSVNITSYRRQKQRISSLVNDLKALQNESKELNTKKDKLEKQLHKMTNGKCPLCGKDK
jgi:exonuclease SbcC